MKNRLLITLLVLFTNYISSQNEEIKLLVDKTEKLNLDMWELSEFAEKNLKTENELARFFYYWIGKNIEYDSEFLRKMKVEKNIHKEYLKKQDEYRVYEDRKGVCAGYANLFSWFMQEADIQVENISGHIRDESNHYVELNSDDDFRHAWNAIKLNGKWILIDTTWGTSNEEAKSEFYFDIKPEHSIITHYPEKSEWQLLENPLTLEKFNNSKFIQPTWFFVGFSGIPKLMSDKDYYYFVFKSNPSPEWNVGLKFSSDNLNFNPIENITTINQDGNTYLKFSKEQMPELIYFKVNLLKTENNYWMRYDDVINFKI